MAPRIRAAFLQAFEEGELHAKMRESLDKDFIGTLNAVAKFVPKELMMMGDPDNPMEGNLSITVNYRKPAIEGEVLESSSK